MKTLKKKTACRNISRRHECFTKAGFLAITIFLLAGCGKSPDQASADLKGLLSHPSYKQLTSEVITGLKDNELEQAIFDNISLSFEGDTREMPEKMKSLSAGQKAIYITWIVEAEITGGGLEHYYSKSGKLLAPFVKEAFQTIGATQHADVMEQANLAYNSLQQNQKPKVDPYPDLENKFEDLADDESLDALKVKYIRDHVEEFVSK